MSIRARTAESQRLDSQGSRESCIVQSSHNEAFSKTLKVGQSCFLRISHGFTEPQHTSVLLLYCREYMYKGHLIAVVLLDSITLSACDSLLIISVKINRRHVWELAAWNSSDHM